MSFKYDSNAANICGVAIIFYLKSFFAPLHLLQLLPINVLLSIGSLLSIQGLRGRNPEWPLRFQATESVSRMLRLGMRAIFYIDGFNFYYLRLKNNPQFKWLNIKALADSLVAPGTTVNAVKYYTAHVSGKVDGGAPQRQHNYFAALRTIPEVEIVAGRFLFSEKWAGLVLPPRAKPDGYVWNLPAPEVVYVNKVEEKGSDVNLGVHLVRDAFKNAFDIAFVLTNDTDLVEPIRIVTQELGKPVGLVAPCRPRNPKGRPIPSPGLAREASFVIYVDDKHLSASQFPSPILRPTKKPLFRPPTW